MEIGANITATTSDFINIDAAELLLVKRNPEYTANKRFSRFQDHDIPEYLTYMELQANKVIVPRNFPEEHFYPASLLKLKDARCYGARKTNFKFRKTFRPYQATFEATLNYERYNDFLIELPTGHGKTLIGAYIAMKRRVPTLILVPTNFLARQFSGSIKKFFTAKVTVASATKKFELAGDEDFFIISLDLFDSRIDKLPADFITYFGHVILDEAHRTGAPAYHPIISRLPAAYRTALTATFRRTDGMDQILQYEFGKHYKLANQFPRPRVYPVRTGIIIDNVLSKFYMGKVKNSAGKSVKKKILYPPTELLVEFMDTIGYEYHETDSCVMFSGNLAPDIDEQYEKKNITTSKMTLLKRANKKAVETASYSTLDTYASERKYRRALIISAVKVAVAAGRKVLLLSKRKESLMRYMRLFEDLYKCTLIVSGTDKFTSEEWENINTEAQVILGIDKLAKEGLDIPDLDTLILEHPLVDTEQALGRINRLALIFKNYPVCLYFVDDCRAYISVYTKSKRFINMNSTLEKDIYPNKIKDIL